MESISTIRFLIASGVMIGLMAALAWGLKYIAARGWIQSMPSNGKRLKLIESMPLDARRRIVIVQCDDKQHLILLGANQDTVVRNDLAVPSSTPVITNE